MASQNQQISTSTVILATAGTLAAGALAYAVYFDYRRRSDPEFRKSLKKQHKKVHKAKEEEAKAAEQGQKEKIKQAVQEANEEGFPRDPEETEGYFMQEVARGEGMCQDGSDPVDAALCFYKALKVYPQPRELITIYDKTVPKVCSSACGHARNLANSASAHPRHPRRDDRRRPQHIRARLHRRRRLLQRRVKPSTERTRMYYIDIVGRGAFLRDEQEDEGRRFRMEVALPGKGGNLGQLLSSAIHILSLNSRLSVVYKCTIIVFERM